MADITQMAARSGKVIRSDNTIVNEADGINDDGSRRVQLTGSCVEEITVLNNVTVLVGSQYANDGYPYLDKYIKARALIWSNQPYGLNFFQSDKYGTPESTSIQLAQDNTPAPTRFHTYDLSSKMPTVRGHFLYKNHGTADATLTIKIHGQKW